MIYESNLQCAFNVGSLKKEPDSFKADRGAM